MDIESLKLFIAITIIVTANLVVWKIFISPILSITDDVMQRLAQQNKETNNLVRDFAAYAASSHEDHPSARFMLSAANHESLDAQLEIAQAHPAGASNTESEPDGFTLTQKG